MINQSNIFKKIGHILNELQDQYEFLSENPEQLSELELELFLANANFLSDHVEIVRKLNNNKPVKQIQQSTSQPVFEVEQPTVESKKADLEIAHTEVEESHSEPLSGKEEGSLIEQIEREELHQDDLPPTFEFIIDKNPVAERFEFEKKPIEEIYDVTLSKEEERISADTPEVIDTEPEPVKKGEDLAEQVQPLAAAPYKAPIAPEVKEVPQIQPELVLDKVEEKQVPIASTDLVIDKIEEKVVPQLNFNLRQESIQPNPVQRPTLNDLLAGNTGSYKTEESAKPPITDLKRSITLNEKLLYIKDLFNGYNLAYSEAIDLINKMPDLKSADAFLKNNYAVKNNWEAKESTVDQFYELLKQRFPVG